MKTSLLIIIIVGMILTSSILAAYLIYLDEPKTPWDCRMKYGKVKQDIQNCLDRINNDEGLKFSQNFNTISKAKIESDFLNKIREAGDNSEPMSLTVISKYDSATNHQNYCGHAHMAIEEYWYFADIYNGDLLSSNVTQSISPWCGDDDDSCYCELREVIGADRRSYEDFFGEHVSETCPIVPMPENATSFDPTQCKWVETKSTSTLVSLPITSCGYPWHESKHEKTKQYYQEYRDTFGDYDSADPQENADAMHYIITRYYEDLGKTILDVQTRYDLSLAGMGEGCNTTVGGSWILKIPNNELEDFLDNGYTKRK